jgi:hypothetical protein
LSQRSGSTWSPDEKVAEALRRIKGLQEKTGKLDELIRTESDERRQEISERTDEVRAELREVYEKVDYLARGSLRIRGWGVILLVPGIVLATWPTEIAGWFGGY